MSAPKADPAEGKIADLSFNVIELLHRERTTFGLRSSAGSSGSGDKDYDRYRHHCSNKIHRLRQVTGQSCGDAKKGFKGVEKIEVGKVKDVKPLQLLLFLSERSYAHSQSLLSLLTKSKTSKTSGKGTSTITTAPAQNEISSRALKKEQLSKLRKSVGYAVELLELVQSIGAAEEADTGLKVSARTRLEILTHALHLRSLLAFHRSQFASSLPPSALRHEILTLLSSPSNCTSSFAQALYSEELDSGEPLVRFVAYNLGRKETHDVDSIVKEFGAEEGAWEEVYPGYAELVRAFEEEVAGGQNEGVPGGTKRGVLEAINWANETVEIRNAGVVDSMVKAQTAIAALEFKRPTASGRVSGKEQLKRTKHANVKTMNKWDAVLAALGEAEAVARRVVEEDQDNSAAARRSSTKSNAQSSPAFVHQYISHLLLSHRIRRDLLLASTLGDPLGRTAASTLLLKSDAAKSKMSRPSAGSSATTPYAARPHGRQPLTRAKKADALKTLNALVKLYDSVLQGLGQIRELGIVEERDGVRRASEGMEAYFKAVRCVKLAQMHLLLPTIEYASAVHLASQAILYSSQAREALSLPTDGTTVMVHELLELFHPISSEKDLAPLESRAQDLENVAKRALYAEVNGRPLFYDTAFNYIELPMDELEIAAGRVPSQSAPAASTGSGLIATAASVVSAPVHAMEGVVETAKKTISAVAPPQSRGRESTPGPEDVGASGEGGSKPKGWFGGLWGGGK